MSLPNITGINSLRQIPRELLEEWLLDMAKRNEERISSSNSLEFLWSPDVTKFIFNVCSTFNLNNCVKFAALEIFERFLALHVMELRSCVRNKQDTDAPLSWESVEERIVSQTILRAMTSIQLASKLESHYDHLLPKQVAELLDKTGKSYSKAGIFNSEIRIINTFKFKMNVTNPSIYVGLLLCVLYTNDPSTDDHLYTASHKVLELVYLNRAKIYDQLYESITGVSAANSPENKNMTKIKADYMLLATAVIATAACIIMKDNWNVILEQLHQVTRIFRTDIRNFTVVIVDILTNIQG